MPATTALAEVGQAGLAVPGVLPEPLERGVDAHPVALRDHALGLLDDDPAVQRRLELLGERLGAADRPLLDQADRGDVGKGLDDGTSSGRSDTGPRRRR